MYGHTLKSRAIPTTVLSPYFYFYLTSAVLLPYYKWTTCRTILTWLKLGLIAGLAVDC